ncbi:uncharacterized protein [Haliotis asinina]|uniref:uncharacterized protein n=1 Tax=Haliotis asinina TaxID=109174 RepID=UPI003531E984
MFTKTSLTMAEDIVESYRSSLQDLTFNSKPLINMLTMLAEDHEQYAPQIVQVIEQHIEQVKPSHKLPTMYLIDSIIKNLSSSLYPKQLSQNIAQTFCGVFEEVDEKTRQSLFKLRQTWKDIFPNKKLYAIDVRVNMMDPAWPITAQAPEQGNIHVNPKFLVQSAEDKARFSPPVPSPPPMDDAEELMRQQLQAKEQELQKLKLELELAETRAKLEEQKKQLEQKYAEQKKGHGSIPSMPIPDPVPPIPTKSAVSVPRDPRLASRDPRKARQVPTTTPPSTGGNLAVLQNTNVVAALSNVLMGSQPAAGTPAPNIDPNVGSGAKIPPQKQDPRKEKYSKDVKKDSSSSKKPSPEKKEKAEPSDSKRSEKKDTTSKSPKKDSRSLREKLKEPSKDTKKKSPKSDTREKSKDRETKGSRKSRSISPRKDRVVGKDKDSKNKVREQEDRRSSDEEYARFKRQNFHRSANEDQEEDRFGRMTRTGRGFRQRNGEKDRPRHDTARGRRGSKDEFERSPRRSRSPQRREKDRNPKPSKKFESKKESDHQMKTLPDLPLPPTMPLDQILPKDFDVRTPKLNTLGVKREAPEMDVDERSIGMRPTGPPDSKRPRTDTGPAEVEGSENLFGGEDIDYRFAGAPMKSPVHDGWMKYKTSRPDEYAGELERRKSREDDHMLDVDLRRIKSPSVKMRPQQVPPTNLTTNISIPMELQLDRQQEILIQAEKQMQAGTLSHEQHQDLLKQLSQVFDIQRTRQKQTRVDPRVAAREAREKIAQDVCASSVKTESADLPLGTSEDIDHRTTVEKSLMDVDRRQTGGDTDIRKDTSLDVDIRKRPTFDVDQQPQSDIDIRRQLLSDLDNRRKHGDMNARKPVPSDTDIRKKLLADLDIKRKQFTDIDARKPIPGDIDNRQMKQEPMDVDIRQKLPRRDPRTRTTDVDERKGLAEKETSQADVDVRQKPVADVDIRQQSAADSNIRQKPAADVDIRQKPTVDIDARPKPAVDVNVCQKQATDVDIRKKPAADVDIRQKQPADVDIRKKPAVDTDIRQKQVADVDIRKKPAVDVDIRQEQAVDVDIRQKTAADINICQKAPADVDARQKNTADIDIRQKSAVDVDNHAKQPTDIDIRSKSNPDAQEKLQAEQSADVNIHQKLSNDVDIRQKPPVKIEKAPEQTVEQPCDTDSRQKSPEKVSSAKPGVDDHQKPVKDALIKVTPLKDTDKNEDVDIRKRKEGGDNAHKTSLREDRKVQNLVVSAEQPADTDIRKRAPRQPLLPTPGDIDARPPPLLESPMKRPARMDVDDRSIPPRHLDMHPLDVDARHMRHSPPHIPREDSHFRHGPHGDFGDRDLRQRPLTKDFDHRGPPHDFDNRGPPRNMDHRGHPRDIDPRGPPRDMDSRGPLLNIDPRGPPRDVDPRGPPRDIDPRGPPRDMDARGMLRNMDPRGPPRDIDPRGPPHNIDPRGPPRDIDSRGPPRDIDPRGPPRDIDPRGPPRDIDSRGPHRDMDPRGAPCDIDTRGPPRDMDTRGPPIDIDPRGPPMDIDPRGSLRNFDGHGPPRDFDIRGPVREFDQQGPPRDFDHIGPPKDLDQRGPPQDLDFRGPLRPNERPDRFDPRDAMPPPRDFDRSRNLDQDLRGPRSDFDQRGPRSRPEFDDRDRPGSRRHHDNRQGRYSRREDRDENFRDGPKDDRFSERWDRRGRGPNQGGSRRHESYQDPRWQAMKGFQQLEAREEFVIDGRAFEIKIGNKPRKLKMKGSFMEIYADPIQRAVLINGILYYKFGEPIKQIEFDQKTYTVYFNGLPKPIWLDGTQHELRIDAPPRNIVIDGKPRGFQIDGRDMMILVDRLEKGTYGGPPRQLLIDNVIHEIRFDAPPRQILIDGQSCDLILDRAIPVVIYNGKPHGIRFDGPPREMIIDDYRFLIPMDNAEKVRIKHKPHYLAFGGPAHEVIINGKRYEIKFDNVPREIVIGHTPHTIRLEGPTPNVKILDEVPTEYENAMVKSLGVHGHAHMTPQGPQMQGPGPMGPQNFGPGGPRPLMQDGPQPMMPGQPMIPGQQMAQPGMGQPMPGMQGGMVMQGGPMMMQNQMIGGMQPMMGGMQMQQGQMMMGGVQQMPMQQGGMFMQQGAPVGQGLGLPSVLSSLLPGAAGMQVPTAQPASVDVGSLFQKLVAAGIIPQGEKTEDKPSESGNGKKDEKSDKRHATYNRHDKHDRHEKSDRRDHSKVQQREIEEKVPEIALAKTDTMKKFYKGVIQKIYHGIQCSSCGTRFRMEDTDLYREHLDWHFRQNKRGKDDTKVARNRNWYYKTNDWIQYEEFGDLEEKAHSQIFDKMLQGQGQTVQETVGSGFNPPPGVDFVSCPPATGNEQDDMCCICHDPFEQYWNEEAEDWHLRDAVRVDKKTYHPVCFQDAREEGTILEPSPTPTTTSLENPLVQQIQNVTANSSKSPPSLTPTQSIPVSHPVTTVTPTSATVKAEPVSKEETVTPATQVPSQPVQEESVTAPVNAPEETPSVGPETSTSTVVKEEPTA